MGFIDWLPGRGKKAVLRGSGRFSVRVRTGERYRQAVRSVAGTHVRNGGREVVQARLVLEDSNPDDPEAVRVDVRDRTVGYLESDFARDYRTWLAEAGYPGVHAYCAATIRASPSRGGGEEEVLAVWLDLPEETGG